MARRSSSKTIVQRDQYELFAKVRAHFADIGAIGKLSLSLSLAFIVTVVTILFSTNEDHWLRPPLTTASVPLLFLFIVAVFAEFIHGMRWIESKAIIAGAHFVAIAGVLTILGVLLWQMRALQASRALERAEETAKIEAAKIEAASTADAKCEKERAEAIEKATMRRADAQGFLQRCKNDFRKSKTIFTQDTVEQRCKQRRVGLIVAERDLEAANKQICSTGAK